MNSLTTANTTTLSERLNRQFHSHGFCAHGPFVVQADDLTLELSPAVAPDNPFLRTLSLNGGYQSTRRPVYVRVIVSLPGFFHPWCDDPDSWVIQDLGLIGVGESIEIELETEAVFHLAFAEPDARTCDVWVKDRDIHITLPDEDGTWQCSFARYSIIGDAELPNMALITPAVSPVPWPPVKPPSGQILPILQGGGTKRDPIRLKVPRDQYPLGLIRIRVFQTEGLLEQLDIRTTLFPLFISNTDENQLCAEIPVAWAAGVEISPPLDYECAWVDEHGLSNSDVRRIGEIMRQREIYSDAFPEECRKRLKAIVEGQSKE